MAYSTLSYISLFNLSLLHLSISYGVVANCFPKCDFPVGISTACFQMIHLGCNSSLELTSVFFFMFETFGTTLLLLTANGILVSYFCICDLTLSRYFLPKASP